MRCPKDKNNTKFLLNTNQFKLISFIFIYVRTTTDFRVFLFIYSRLRQESELLSRSSSQHWSQSDLQLYASTTNVSADAELAYFPNSRLSTETLKWLGSMSDVSSSSHNTNTSHISASGNYYRNIWLLEITLCTITQQFGNCLVAFSTQ